MRRKTFLRLAEYQTEQSAKHLDEVRSIHCEMRGYKHDFHHHLQTLRVMLDEGETFRALEYIDELDKKLLSVDTLLKTGHVALDAILAAKLSQAKSEKIFMSVKANIPPKLTLSDVEMSIIIGNLLDNALEACRKCEGEPFIRLYIVMKGNMLYFSLTNSSGKKLKKKGSIFGSHKGQNHGFGLRRAEAIIKAHGGWIKYNSEDGAFTSEFLVPALL